MDNQLRLFPSLDLEHEKEIAAINKAKEVIEKADRAYAAIDRIFLDPACVCATIACRKCGDTSLIGQYETECPQCGAYSEHWKILTYPINNQLPEELS